MKSNEAVPISANQFYETPVYLVAWPNLSMVLPPKHGGGLYGEESFDQLSFQKKGNDLIISGRRVTYETYPRIRYDLRDFGFRQGEAREMKCYWADPDGTLVELTRVG